MPPVYKYNLDFTFQLLGPLSSKLFNQLIMLELKIVKTHSLSNEIYCMQDESNLIHVLCFTDFGKSA